MSNNPGEADVLAAHTIAQRAVREWAKTQIAKDRCAVEDATAQGWKLDRRHRLWHTKTVAEFPLPATLMSPEEADRWSLLARAVSLEFSQTSWMGTLLAPVSAGVLGALYVTMLTGSKYDAAANLWRTVVAGLLVAGVMGGLLVLSWFGWHGRMLRAKYVLAPLWRERAADYERRGEVLRRDRQAPPVVLSVSAWARPWRRRAPR